MLVLEVPHSALQKITALRQLNLPTYLQPVCSKQQLRVSLARRLQLYPLLGPRKTRPWPDLVKNPQSNVPKLISLFIYTLLI